MTGPRRAGQPVRRFLLEPPRAGAPRYAAQVGALRGQTMRGVTCALALLLLGCEQHPVDIEASGTGRSLSRDERKALQHIADETFREARSLLKGLPPRLTLIVTFSKEVIPETGESGAAGYPGNVALTLDPDRDVSATIRTSVRPCLLHELHHLARRSRMPPPRTLRDRVVFEGLATKFERDTTHVVPPWGELTPDVSAWTREILQLPSDTTDTQRWFEDAPKEGPRFPGIRAGALLAERAGSASGKSAAQLVFASTNDVLTLARFE